MAKRWIIALASIPLLASGALAANTTSAAPVAKPSAAKVDPRAAKPSIFRPATGAASAKPVVHHATAAVTGARMVTTKTSTGKTITYDCSKAGNLHKKACT